MRNITVVGGNMFRLAAEQLSDATQWIRIAQANNLTDPIIVGVVSLWLPDRDPTAGGGIAPQ